MMIFFLFFYVRKIESSIRLRVQDRKLESKQIVTCVTINNRNEL